VEKVVGKDFGLLKQRYAINIAKKMAARMFANITEEILPNGDVRLKIEGRRG
jgi:hypothetical protein